MMRRDGVATPAEEEDESHLNPFLLHVNKKPSSSKLQFRKEISKVQWHEKLGLGEVVEKKGSIWTTTGIVRDGKLYCHIEEILFLAERGGLLLLDSDDAILNMKEIYTKIAEGRHKCSWESFEAYRHLKLLGYIVGRHCVPWTNKANTSCCNSDSFNRTSDEDVGFVEAEEKMPIIHQFKNMQIHDIIPTFDVYLPNSKFRKSSPGKPNFLLCLLRDKPPSRTELENLEKKCLGIPLKFCFVDHGRVSFFSYDRVVLPILP
ncbi:tRNA-splicing endonuclease subunit Sen54 protein [Dioscorea alata]|uniref:tRNA-splicing endonuclease subunit Sen54 protein n=5 Tax=Dioscorea alata TaxID=55571 RepID=A0ACB7W646_DIOAL|nr:tRNA-splicing endonuclease subunit Sen54 protein [Dioscorea alata]KAH7683103.1 tRNA-splicing endonuclease subunit Sen54 protein [Dioscorea alata]KAH7683104.1 tRNA-splicing endonuclease subunit Sen54 protein [Dioscorea alata]KAH7683105.1 tRNA-splicing endonuclease subunit Sen54 protein [Dioscorea alata]KAH7683106.1 tRNA-splicing endonuclease subunit Sen54 protein [Dioscorea alata]